MPLLSEEEKEGRSKHFRKSLRFSQVSGTERRERALHLWQPERDLLQCGKFSGYLCGNAAVQMCVEIDVVINSIFCFHRR